MNIRRLPITIFHQNILHINQMISVKFVLIKKNKSLWKQNVDIIYV